MNTYASKKDEFDHDSQAILDDYVKLWIEYTRPYIDAKLQTIAEEMCEIRETLYELAVEIHTS